MTKGSGGGWQLEKGIVNRDTILWFIVGGGDAFKLAFQ